MYVIFEESGAFKAEKILSEADNSLQTEAESGKRNKIKKNNVIFTYNQGPAFSELITQAQAQADQIDIPFLWECAPADEFEVDSFAQDYYGHAPNIVEKVGLLFALHSAPIYFHRKGKGRYKAAPDDILQAALASQEKKRQQLLQQEAWVQEIVSGTLPEAIKAVAPTFALRPDKNTMEWKAFELAMAELNMACDALLLKLGVFPHNLALLRYKFLKQYFAKGTAIESIPLPEIKDLPISTAKAYSIDDKNTTEIDDALSVEVLDNGQHRFGIHIAVPALIIERDSDLDKVARNRMSTVYMPGDKIPMQSDDIINAFSLNEGRQTPALSLYIDVDLASQEITAKNTVLENITVVENLRSNTLDELISEEALEDPESDLPYAELFRPLWQFSRQLKKQREIVRGKPENNTRVEYAFQIDGPADDPNSIVHLIARRRNAPLDQMVAEFMILANATWGGYLKDNNVPGVYRSQQAGRVRMSTHALPHDTIGVEQYAWTTSPLRRYVDLVNQRQILCVLEHGISAPLVAPFKNKDVDLFAIIGAFENQYSAWADFQSQIERYWCLRWFIQNDVKTLEATVLKEKIIRFNNAPFVIEAPGIPELNRGDLIEIEISDIDEMNLSLSCRFIRCLNEPEQESDNEQ